MFHQGDLQSGITRAIQEGKVVTCFVRDNGTESRTWKDEYLAKQPLKYLKRSNGQLRAVLNGSLTYDDLFLRLTDAIEPEGNPGTTSHQSESSRVSLVAQTTHQSSLPTQESTPSTNEALTPSESASPRSSSPQPSSAVQKLLQERKERLEAERKVREEKEKAERAAKAKAKREATEHQTGSRSAEVDYAAQERKRKQQNNAERERVRKLVENDKIERQEREARRKQELAAGQELHQSESEARAGPSSAAARPAGACAVQVRLFDGSTIRTRFDSPSTQTLSSSVRTWVDSQLKSSAGAKSSAIPPYTFKHVLTPLPNRTLEVGEEEKTLQELGLTPTATLVLVPVQGYTDAYASSGVSGWLSWLYGMVAGAFFFIFNALREIVGMIGGPGTASPPESGASDESSGVTQAGSLEKRNEGRPSTKMKTLRDTKDEKDEKQFYNGNQLNFEPRPEDKDKKDE
ncbi:MAG: hypothetical protein Q9165_006219 [Trypethelium subeluteriae]